MAVQLFIVLVVLLQLAASLHGAYSLPVTCTATSTSSTSLATNVTTSSASISCSFTQQPSSFLGGCSAVNVTLSPTTTANIAATKATYSCYFVDTSAEPLTHLLEETIECSGLISTAASTASTSIHGNASCSYTVTIIADNTTTSLQNLQLDAASDCVVSTPTIAGAPIYPNASSTSTSVCSVFSTVRNDSTILLTWQETTNCTTMATTTFRSSALLVQKSIGLCDLNFTTSTQPQHFKDAFAHGAMFF
ncbi:hypothetical protein L7F22_052572 [Adiantum nelumboides]|nr:hypothetical protein [Adiantum nelumboides]